MLTILLLATLTGVAQQPDLEAEARQIEAALIAPCCWSQQVSVHHSPAADEIRATIRTQLKAGKTREQILDAYVEYYGTRILAEPPARGFTATLYIVPLVLFFATAGLVVQLVRRFARRAEPQTAPAVAGPDPYERELDDQLRDLD
jgi:cytochrome c-type biogenesis protein CcmH